MNITDFQFFLNPLQAFWSAYCCNYVNMTAYWYNYVNYVITQFHIKRNKAEVFNMYDLY